MLTKTMIALSTAIILSTVSGTVAMAQGKGATYSGTRAEAITLWSKRDARPFTAEEAAWFDRASRPSDY